VPKPYLYSRSSDWYEAAGQWCKTTHVAGLSKHDRRSRSAPTPFLYLNVLSRRLTRLSFTLITYCFMPKPVVLSIVASTIAVASLAYKSTKSLIDFIDSLHDAPTLISDLRGDVQAVQNILRSIELILENRDDRQLSGDLRVCLSSAHMPVKDCQAVSEEFEKKLRDWFRDSAWDRLKANFKEAKIAKFRTRLRDTRDTLDLALNICSM
jgi:hypothetical protein